MIFNEQVLYDYLIGLGTIFPWGLTLILLFPIQDKPRAALGIFLALALGWASTVLILWIHPLIWPETDFSMNRKTSILTQTAHLAFVQAGMMEEFFKSLGILLLGLALTFNFKTKLWTKSTVLLAGFVALGFSWIENTQYISSELDNMRRIELFVARTVHSANIHLMINLCFGFFLLKSNSRKTWQDKAILVSFAFALAVFQHGVVDFLLIPGSIFGQWISTALFVGIWVWVVRDWREFISVPKPPRSEFFSK